MAKSDNALLSKSAYARSIGVDESAIRKAIAEGKIKKGWDAVNKKIIKKVADKEYGFMHLVPSAKAGQSKTKLIAKIEGETSPEIRTAKSKISERSPKTATSPKTIIDKSEKTHDNLPSSVVVYQDGERLDITINASDSYGEATRKREIISLALDKKKLEELEDVLIRREKIERVLFAYGESLKKGLLAIPARVIEDIRSATDSIEANNVLTNEITRVLSQYADFQKVPLTNK